MGKRTVAISLGMALAGTALAGEERSSAAENMARRKIAYITAGLVEYADLTLEGTLPASYDEDLASAGVEGEWARCLDLANEAARNNTLYGDGTQQGADDAFYAAAHTCVCSLEEEVVRKMCGVVLKWD